ncbi:hypothetical protein CgunFtcFv8_015788 [Champsocephalus gunnari]|uniref:Uncharacterized protein n=1 Tax=Champsocephalus gunnari TaxID=52237 RepID=A0AAN8C7A0_CHAGU|nr:hypothetical protein CgunFtcFv8_015788 [Champsocephalus gunnari]
MNHYVSNNTASPPEAQRRRTDAGLFGLEPAVIKTHPSDHDRNGTWGTVTMTTARQPLVSRSFHAINI